MKKTILTCILFLPLFFQGQSSNNTANYDAIDSYALTLKHDYYSTKELAKKLTSDLKTEEEKVRVIFRWITDNIAYDCKAFHNPCKVAGKTSDEVLQSKKALCGQYARLFNDLCKASGLQCYIVCGLTGNKKIVNFFRAIKMFNTNHAWNKVKIEDNWYYLDVTWASGGCNRMVTRFYKQFNPNYYLVPENELYNTHAEEKTESADYNDLIGNKGYPKHELRRPFLNIFYCTNW